MEHDDSDDYEDDTIDIEFPEVINFKSFENEVIHRRNARYQVKEAGDWLTFRSYSPVLDAWGRWNHSTAITDLDVCSLLNVSTSCASLKLVKSYLVGEHVSISVEELKDVLEISDMLIVGDLVNYCKYRIQNIELNEDNFLQILEVSSLYDFIHPAMKYFVMSHLPLLTDTDGSYGLTYDTVVVLLTEDVLMYWTMTQRFNFIVKWCKACVSRVELFVGLFELIDVSCLEQDFLQSVVKTENFVCGSDQCMRRVDDALQSCRTSTHIPAVVIGDAHSNRMSVFNLKTRVPGICPVIVPVNRARVSIEAWTVLLPDNIILMTCDRNVREVVKYNIHTRKTESKYLYSYVTGSNVPMGNIKHIICQHDMSFFTDLREVSSLRQTKVRRSRLPGVQVCTVFMKHKEFTDMAKFLPMMSFKFEIKQMCIIGSTLVLRSNSETQIHCFNWTNYSLTKTSLPQDMHSASPSSLLTLLPSEEALYAVFQSYIIQCTFDESTAEMTSVRKFYVDVGSDPFVTIATTEGALIRVDNECIHVCESIQHSSQWQSIERPDRGDFLPNRGSTVNYAFLEKSIAMCHQDCPHCGMCPEIPEIGYTDFGEPYQIKLQLKESARQQRENSWPGKFTLDSFRMILFRYDSENNNDMYCDDDAFDDDDYYYNNYN